MDKLKDLYKRFIPKNTATLLPKNPFIQKYQHFILPAFSLVITLIVLLLITLPQFFSLLNTYKTLEEIKPKQAQAKNRLSQLEGINKKLYKDNLNTALIALPAEKDIPGVVDQILFMLSRSGMHLDAITFSHASDSSSTIPNLQVKLDVSGTDEQLKSFIAKAKESPRIIKINAIEFNTGVQTGQVQARVNLLAFYQDLPPTIANTTTTVPTTTPDDQKLLSEIKKSVNTIPPLSDLDTSKIQVGKDDPFQ